MTESRLTLRSLFFDDDAKAGVPSVETHDSMFEVKQDFAEKLPDLPWRTVAAEMNAKADEVLSLGIDEILVAAWKKHQRLQGYRDPAKHPPTETIFVTLAKHRVKTAYDPAVKVLVADTEVGSLDFQSQLALELEGIVLKIQAGRILEIQAGSCRGSGSLRCVVTTKFSSKALFERKASTKKYRFDGLSLGDGVELPG